MAVNKPRIAGKPATERKRVKDHRFEPKPANPYESYIVATPEGLPLPVEPSSPDREGQMYFHVYADSSSNNRQAQIYIGVNVGGGVLEWKPVNSATFLNLYTGKPYDPIYDG